MKHRLITLAIVSLAVSAYGKTLVVNNNPANTSSPCKTAHYTTISAAITAASSWDTVSVCPGTYPEALLINKSHLTLTGLVTSGSSLIELMPTAGISIADVNPGAEDPTENVIVLVEGVIGVTINNLSINGSKATTTCGSGNAGIYFRNASGVVTNAAVAYIGLNADGTLTGCQEGYGIYADSWSGGTSSLTVFGTSVHDFDKNGIAAREAGTTLVAENNEITGAGSTTVTAQNGVELVDGAKGLVNGNVISGVDYTPTSSSATGILFYAADDYGQANGNTISDTNGGVYFYNTNHGKANGNNISKTFNFNGLGANGSYITFENNVVTRSGLETDSPAIYLCGSKNVVAGNLINDAPSGVQDDRTSADGCNGASGNSIFSNTYFNVGVDVYESTNAAAVDLTGEAIRMRAQSLPRPAPSK